MSPGRLLVLFALYAAALDLATSRGILAGIASPVGLALLVGAGVLSGWRAVVLVRSAGPFALRAARAMLGGGAALALVAIPGSFLLRQTRQLAIGEGETLGPGPGLPLVRFGEVRLAPRGPNVLSKAVTIQAFPEGGAPVQVGLFPPRALGGWRATIARFGYAIGLVWLDEGGRSLARGPVKLGALPREEEADALVSWSPEPNVMMGAGTFPPKLEDLLSPPGTGAHLFLRLDGATLAGARRDLRDPDAYRWLVDGRLEDPVLFAQVFRGKEKVWEGRIRAGEGVRFPGGALSIERRVSLWVDLLLTRDLFLPWAGAGLALLAAGVAVRGALGARELARRLASLRSRP